MNLIPEGIVVVVPETNVTWWPLADAAPFDASDTCTGDGTLVVLGRKDSNIEPVSVDVGVDAIRSVVVVFVPAVDLVKVKLDHNMCGVMRHQVGLEGVFVGLDEPSQELRKPGIVVNLAVGPTCKRSVFKILHSNHLLWYTAAAVFVCRNLDVVVSSALVLHGCCSDSCQYSQVQLAVLRVEAFWYSYFDMMDLIHEDILVVAEPNVCLWALRSNLPINATWGSA